MPHTRDKKFKQCEARLHIVDTNVCGEAGGGGSFTKQICFVIHILAE